MAAEATLEGALQSFKTATQAAYQNLPESSSLLPPENGITLLDAKNEIFLSYLQALALRNLAVIRGLKHGSDAEELKRTSSAITKSLVEQRVYLERGVRPLEQKIKYQVDKVLKAAEDEARAKTLPKPVSLNGHGNEDGINEDLDGEEEEEEEDIDELSFRPNPAAFSQPSSRSDDRAAKRGSKDGVYRPPRISATTMPTNEKQEKKSRDRPARSATVDEYISTEMSAAPLAEPSIGSTIAAGGRHTKDARQLAKEQERRNYEEANLIRLPKESKKELAKSKSRERGGFGGEEWRGLGESIDRITDATKRRGGKNSTLDKSRKRQAIEDGQRDSGIGDAFDVKRRRLLKKANRRG